MVSVAGLLPNSSVMVDWEGSLGGGPKDRLLGVVVVSVKVSARVVTGEALRVAVGLGGDLERGPMVRTEWVWVRCGSGRLGGRLDIALVGDANLDGEVKATLEEWARWEEGKEVHNRDRVRGVDTCNVNSDRVSGCIQIELLFVTTSKTIIGTHLVNHKL